MYIEGLIKRSDIHEAAQLFNHIGYEDRYYLDVWRACIEPGEGKKRPFRTPHQLAEVAFMYAAGQSISYLHRLIASRTSAPDQLAAVLEGFEHLFSDPPLEGGCALFNALTDEGCDPAIQALARRQMQSVELAIEHLLHRGKTAGVFECAMQPAAFAAHITGTLEGAFRLGRSYKSTGYLRTALQHLRRMGMLSMCTRRMPARREA